MHSKKFWQLIFLLLSYVLHSSAFADEFCPTSEELLSKVSDWGVVSKIIDGDTVHLKDGRKIRLIGINTPEIGRHGEASQPFARQAYDVLVKLLKNNKRIGLSYDIDRKDRYKRILAYITLTNGQSIEQALLSKGLAHSIVVPPNDSRIKCYRYLEKKAREANLGLWKLSENQWIRAGNLSSKAKGLRYVSGIISAYSESKKSIYLKLSSKLSIRIAKKDKKYFSEINLKELNGRRIRVRGWANTYKGRQSISVRTSHDFSL